MTRFVGFALLGAVFLAWIAGSIAPYDVVADVDPGRASLGPSAAHWLGTDHLGRDVAWRLLLGSSAFVAPGLAAAALAGVVGGLLGTVGGWFGGPTALVVRSLFTVTSAVPRFIFILLTGAVFGARPSVLAVATAVASAPAVGEAVIARIDQLRRMEFVTALRAHGLTDARILLWHVLWINVRGLLLRQVLTTFGFFLVVETTLSYLGGFGVQEPTPSWGNMLAFEFGIPDGNPAAWLAPAVAIWLAILATALLGQGLGLREGAWDDEAERPREAP